MSTVTGRIISLLWPWKTGPLAGAYKLLLQPGLFSLANGNPGPVASQVSLSLVSRPGYLSTVVKESYESMRFLHGKKLPLRVKIVGRDVSRSFRFGLVQADHSIQARGEKRYVDQLFARIRDTIASDQQGAGVNSPQVLAQTPAGWLQSGTSGPMSLTTTATGESDGWLRPLGALSLVIGVVAALAWFSNAKAPGTDRSLETAIAHLKSRGANDLQMLREEPVEGGEKFYFQSPTESYTVIVDKDGRVYSWSRAPSNSGGTGLK